MSARAHACLTPNILVSKSRVFSPPDFSVNGALDPLPGRGFNRIVVHFGPEHFVDVDAGGVSVTEGPKRSRFTGEELIMAGR